MSIISPEKALAIALEAGGEAAKIIRTSTRRKHKHKGAIDLVTETDLASEAIIIDTLKKQSPAIPVLAEEGGGCRDQETRWIIDPLDGTTNFVHGIPYCCVSIALEWEGKLTVGCIIDPFREETFTAIAGMGAWRNDVRIYVSEKKELQESLLLTGFPCDRWQRADFYLKEAREFMVKSQGIRRLGSAALDLAYVACGRGDGFWEHGLSAWDVAAGCLIVEEAGGKVSKMDGSIHRLSDGDILAAPPPIWEQMRTVFNSLNLGEKNGNHGRN